MSHLPSSIFVLFGATGDLARKKLLPAIIALKEHNPLSKFFIIGAAKDAGSSEIFQDPIFKQISDIFEYVQVDFNNKSDYERLKLAVDDYKKKLGIKNKIIYCATAAQFYCTISQHCHAVGLAMRGKNNLGGTDTLVYEKPFGMDECSSRKINGCLKALFDETQMYRVDHYLTKSLVTSLLLLRFSNPFFKAPWNNTYIDHVQIIFSETVSIAGRGEFYDAFGALKDVVQNHVFQLFSLIALKEPHHINAQTIAHAKAEILKKTQFIGGVLGQYDGYLHEQGVKNSSKTETYAALEFAIDTPDWYNVPFFIKTGKNLPEKKTEIHIVFKHMPKDIFGAEGKIANSLVLQITPRAGFQLHLNAQKPGELYSSIPIEIDYCYSCSLGPEHPATYEILLHQILLQDRLIAVNPEEIEAAWRIIDTIKKQNLPVFNYEPGTSGPKEAEEFMERKHLSWKV